MMKHSRVILSLVVLIGAAGPAFAGELASPATAVLTTATLKPGAYLRSADGRRVGVVDDVATARDGAPVDAQVIVDSRIVHIPASTITANDKDHFTTSLSYKDIKAL